MTTNAADTGLATALVDIGDSGQGTLVFLTVRKKGTARGPSASRVIYGNDLVQVLIWTGFDYKALIERSHKKLHSPSMWGSGTFIKDLMRATMDRGCLDVTLQDAAEAVQELDDRFLRVINGVPGAMDSDQEPMNPVWEPLKVEGQIVRGGKVYVGAGDVNDPRAPVPGTIYMDGVKLGENVLDPAPNGAWLPKQRAKTVAKEVLESWLPIGLYVRYCLDKEGMTTVQVGSAASGLAKQAGIPIDPEAIRSLFKIAP